MKHPTEEQWILRFYGEIDDPRVMDGHLASCDGCARRYAELEQDLSAVATPSVPERDPAYEARLWQALEPRLESRDARAAMGWFRMPRLALAGTMAVLLVAAFLFGRWSDGPPADPIAPEARDRILLVAVGDHLERTQRLLIELVNAGDGSGTDLSSQQASARDLAVNNRLYRQTAGNAGRSEIVDLLEELESLLLEVANGPSQPAYAELAALQRRIAGRGLVMRIRVLEQRTRIDAGPASRRDAGQTREELEL